MKTTIIDLKNEQEKKISALIAENKVFFAFDNKQFNEGKEKNQITSKIADIGMGGFAPAENAKPFKDGLDSITEWFNNEIIRLNLIESHILYTLSNHECFYTGDYQDAFFLPYDKELIKSTFYKFYNEYTQNN